MIKLIIPFTLLLNTVSSYACGDHENVMADSGLPFVHHSFLEQDEKQFPDPSIVYNGSHRGMATYRTNSLKGAQKLALTYDDGPHPTRTPKLLDILKKYNVKATFFAMGELVERYPLIAKRIVDEGHILASHDWRHDNSNGESQSVFRAGLKNSILEVKKHYKDEETYYRFPYGAYGRSTGYHHFNVMKELSQDLFGDNCINFAFWDIDTSDWVADMDPQDIVQTLFANLNGGTAYRFRTYTSGGRTRYAKDRYRISNPIGGGVVLMHDIHQRTIEATELFLRQAQGRNIEFVLLKNVEEFEYTNQTCFLNQ